MLARPNCPPLYDCLGEDGIELFRGTFQTNNATLTHEFLEDPFIRRIWTTIVSEMQVKDCFDRNSPVEKIIKTYSLVTVKVFAKRL